MHYISLNGIHFPEEQPVLKASNRSFKYGDGVFETIKVVQGNIQLQHYHFERLFNGLKILNIKFDLLNSDFLSRNIIELCSVNNCLHSARVRLAIYRNEVNEAEYIIEASELPLDTFSLNKKGLSVELFTSAIKHSDFLSNLKTANYLPYILASIAAKEKNVDDCILLNAEGNVCDSSKANIFIIKDKKIITPSSDQGCVLGVMRRHIISECNKSKMEVIEQPVSMNDLEKAEEVFLSNAIIGINWVKNFKDKQYTNNYILSTFSQIMHF
jgi:branched-chain amino acid aminotransferase